MDWAVVTWLILFGVVGLLWVMALAVIQDESPEQSSEASSEEATPQDAGDGVQASRRSAA